MGESAQQIKTPMDLIGIAIQSGAKKGQLRELRGLAEQHARFEADKAFNAAFTAAQSEFPPIAKTAQAHNSKYAPLHQITESVRPVLEKHGLGFCHEMTQDSDTGALTVRAVVTHAGGASRSAALVAPPDTSGSKNPVQALGSTVTYLRRYTLESVLGLTTRPEDDTDGVVLISEDQIDDISKRLGKLDKPTQEAFMRWLKTKKVDAVAEIPMQLFGEVSNNLDRKLQKS